MNNYSFNIAWSDEDGGYIATCPEFPGLSAFGKTVEVALSEAKVALALFVKTFEEDGLPLPAPQVVPHYSGQTRLRLPKSVHRLVSEVAASDGVSLNQFIVDAINEKLGAQKIGDRFVAELKKALAESAEQRRKEIAQIVWQEAQPGTHVRRTVRQLIETSTEEGTGTLASLNIVNIKGH